ncbi:MAG: hypothetical protein M1839_002982 [Geoglossum umbratile]|nr:MAG: hypothetical protein M1839_002982 [Geoglossum umbratile]
MDKKWKAHIAERLRSISLTPFIKRTETGETIGGNFAALASAVALTLDKRVDVQYVQSGSGPMYARTDENSEDKVFKPDFFTSKIRQGHLPGSYSAILDTKSDRSRLIPALRILIPSPILTPPHGRAISSRRNKSNKGPHLPRSQQAPQTPCSAIVIPFVGKMSRCSGKSRDCTRREADWRKLWGRLILKATEVLRYQWYRNFVLGFLVHGVCIRMFRIDRSGVIVSGPMVPFHGGFGETTPILIRCILACLVVPQQELGFPRDNLLRIAYKGDKPRLVVLVKDEELVLKKQIFARRDQLLTRGTTAYIAKRDKDEGTEYCFKSSWPYRARKHEGGVLETLQEVPGVVELLAWDILPSQALVTADRLHKSGDFAPLKIFYGLIYHHSSQEPHSPHSQHSPLAGPREHRLVVTEYIPVSFITGSSIAPLHLLCAWRSLYRVVDRVMEKDWVHHDLSMTNARLRFDKEEYSAVLIDFDNASVTTGVGSGEMNGLGTQHFRPLEILDPEIKGEIRHQELHEDETVFWVGLLTPMSCSDSHSRAL